MRRILRSGVSWDSCDRTDPLDDRTKGSPDPGDRMKPIGGRPKDGSVPITNFFFNPERVSLSEEFILGLRSENLSDRTSVYGSLPGRVRVGQRDGCRVGRLVSTV